MKEMFNWQDYQDRLGEWSDSVFGDDRYFDSGGSSLHLQEEAKELHEHPQDLSEYADCLMLIIDKARLEGINIASLETALERKLKINQGRKWVKVEHGYYKHID